MSTGIFCFNLLDRSCVNNLLMKASGVLVYPILRLLPIQVLQIERRYGLRLPPLLL